MELIEIINRKVAWPMSQSLTPEQQEINQWIFRLDEVARETEARWGIDRLPNIVSPEMTVRWNTQMEKLNNAIIANDLLLVRELAQGTIRGWKKLEDEAVSRGETKNKPDVWDVRSPEGKHYRVCKNLNDARLWANQPGAVVYTLEEIARILDQNQLTVLHPAKAVTADDREKQKFDFKKGDSLPW